MSYVFDIAVILIVAITVFFGYRRGFIRTVVQLVGCVLALVLAFSLSQTVSAYVYENVVRDTVYEKVNAAWEESTAHGVANLTEKVDAFNESLPNFLQTLLDTDAVTDDVHQFLNGGEKETSVSAFLTDTVLQPILLTILRIIAFLILYAVLMVAVKLVTKLIKPLSKLPLIRQADGLLGAACGLLKGLVFAFIAVTVIQLLSVGGNGVFAKKDLDNSYIAGRLAERNPLSDVLNLD